MKDFINRVLNKLRNETWKFRRNLLVKKLRKRFEGPIPTIFSCNCTGGVLYHDLGLPFNSPTINLYMSCADFIKFLENLDYYLTLQMTPYFGDIKRDYPLAFLGDLTLFLVHYQSVQQAIAKWQDRKKRIDHNNIYVIATDRDGFNEELLHRFNKLPFRKKIFTHKPVESPDCVYIRGFEDEPQIGGLMEPRPGGLRVIDQFDWVRWLSSTTHPYRLLVIGLSGNHGGVETYVRNMLTNFEPNTFEIYIPRNAPYMAYENELNALGAKFIEVPKERGWRFLQFYKGWHRVFRQYKFDAVYMNDCSVTGIDIIRMAKWHKVPVRIFHAHNTSFDAPLSGLRALQENRNKHTIHKTVTNLYSCSKEAAEWMFSKVARYRLISNAVNCDRFSFNSMNRETLRSQLGISKTENLIGFIGRLSAQKYPELFVQVCSSLQQREANYRFVIVGDGEHRTTVEKLIETYLFPTNSIQLLGIRHDIPELMSAMDCLVMTSRYEGFPFVLVEAQATGLPCVVSDTIPQETNILGNVRFVSLEASLNQWEDAINSALKDCTNRPEAARKMRAKGYDIKESVQKIERKLIEGIESSGAIK